MLNKLLHLKFYQYYKNESNFSLKFAWFRYNSKLPDHSNFSSGQIDCFQLVKSDHNSLKITNFVFRSYENPTIMFTNCLDYLDNLNKNVLVDLSIAEAQTDKRNLYNAKVIYLNLLYIVT